MRVMKSFTIEDAYIEDLKKVNASGLINELLSKHFNQDASRDLTILNQKLNDKEQELEILDKQREHIQRNINTILAEDKKKLAEDKLSKEEKEYNDKAEGLKTQWQSDEITEEEFYNAIDELRDAKPIVDDDTQLHGEENEGNDVQQIKPAEEKLDIHLPRPF